MFFIQRLLSSSGSVDSEESPKLQKISTSVDRKFEFGRNFDVLPKSNYNSRTKHRSFFIQRLLSSSVSVDSEESPKLQKISTSVDRKFEFGRNFDVLPKTNYNSINKHRSFFIQRLLSSSVSVDSEESPKLQKISTSVDRKFEFGRNFDVLPKSNYNSRTKHRSFFIQRLLSSSVSVDSEESPKLQKISTSVDRKFEFGRNFDVLPKSNYNSRTKHRSFFIQRLLSSSGSVDSEESPKLQKISTSVDRKFEFGRNFESCNFDVLPKSNYNSRTKHRSFFIQRLLSSSGSVDSEASPQLQKIYISVDR